MPEEPEGDSDHLSPMIIRVNFKHVLMNLLMQKEISRKTFDEIRNHLTLKSNWNILGQVDRPCDTPNFSLEEMSLIVLGFSNEHVFTKVQDFDFVCDGMTLKQNIELIDSDLSSLIKQLIAHLRLYCHKHDCNVAILNSHSGKSEIQQKRMCRA